MLDGDQALKPFTLNASMQVYGMDSVSYNDKKLSQSKWNAWQIQDLE